MNRRAIPAGMTFDCWRAADGWHLRQFAWPATAPRGQILFLGGRGDFVEKYLEAFSHWHECGWSLAGFDWRGQGGSGRYLADPHICHIPAFDPLVDDLAAFAGDWTSRTTGPHVIVAHSLGAHLALHALAARRLAVDGAVLLAPMLELRPLPAALARLLAAIALRCGRGARPLWQSDPGNLGGRMTSCPTRRADKLWWKAARPEIASGAPSWAWLAAACASIAKLGAGNFGAVAMPLLMLAAKRDPVIDVGALRRAAIRLPQAELGLFDAGGHELLREADPVRLPVLRAIDAFLVRVEADAVIHSVTLCPDRGGNRAEAR